MRPPGTVSQNLTAQPYRNRTLSELRRTGPPHVSSPMQLGPVTLLPSSFGPMHLLVPEPRHT